jgi:hypothetical protein
MPVISAIGRLRPVWVTQGGPVSNKANKTKQTKRGKRGGIQTSGKSLPIPRNNMNIPTLY